MTTSSPGKAGLNRTLKSLNPTKLEGLCFTPKSNRSPASIWDWGHVAHSVPLLGAPETQRVFMIEAVGGWIQLNRIPGFMKDIAKTSARVRPADVLMVTDAPGYHYLEWSFIGIPNAKKRAYVEIASSDNQSEASVLSELTELPASPSEELSPKPEKETAKPEKKAHKSEKSLPYASSVTVVVDSSVVYSIVRGNTTRIIGHEYSTICISSSTA